jgi:hypothetical protein
MCISSLLDFLCVCVIHYAGDVSRWPLTQLVEESGRHGLIVNKLDTGNAAKFFGILQDWKFMNCLASLRSFVPAPFYATSTWSCLDG